MIEIKFWWCFLKRLFIGTTHQPSQKDPLQDVSSKFMGVSWEINHYFIVFYLKIFLCYFLPSWEVEKQCRKKICGVLGNIFSWWLDQHAYLLMDLFCEIWCENALLLWIVSNKARSYIGNYFMNYALLDLETRRTNLTKHYDALSSPVPTHVITKVITVS